MTMPVPLKPCPFCGGEAEFERIGTPRRSTQVRCGGCGAHLESSDEGDHASDSWNRRMPSEDRAALKAVRKALSELMANHLQDDVVGRFKAKRALDLT